MTKDEAELVGIKALQFLARDETRFARFLTLSGVDPEAIAANAGEVEFLAGVMEHLISDESLLFLFACEAEIPPELPAQAHLSLTGCGGR